VVLLAIFQRPGEFQTFNRVILVEGIFERNMHRETVGRGIIGAAIVFFIFWGFR
jgi:hypothetical protein